ncbi:hypothetical protein N658DRAFT_91964 [Parathielavia hyrcaniae]|uniref:Uncharacterized protein n=1 Tax=Parathielavia hyrcaniae TaxID=113614 RepID=A0AAN6Q461_9PEZI|nr:hypothetical protein N658DRAFT_91964 [Parathielavia hyrcaniae]
MCIQLHSCMRASSSSGSAKITQDGKKREKTKKARDSKKPERYQPPRVRSRDPFHHPTSKISLSLSQRNSTRDQVTTKHQTNPIAHHPFHIPYTGSKQPPDP